MRFPPTHCLRGSIVIPSDLSKLSEAMLHVRIIRTSLLVPLALLCCGAPQTLAAQIYSEDPTHLWNRLYDATMVRTNVGITYDDLLDPPYWYRTKYLLDGAANRRAIKLLGEFSADRALAASMSAQQKAIMQRDLLGIFTCAVSKQTSEKPARALAKALARAIRHVAMDAASINTPP